MSAPATPTMPGAPPRRRGRLFRKYILLFVALVGGTLLANGALELWFSYRENTQALARIQQEKALAAAARIEQFIDEITRQIGWTTRAQWSRTVLEQRRFEYLQLLRQAPAVTEVSHLDAQGREELRVSRLAMDVIGSGTDFSGDPKFTEARARKTWFSPVYFRKESEPYITVAIAGTGRDSGVTVAEVNLKFIWDVISRIKVGQGGYAYVVDTRGLLIAHPDIGLVLRKTDFSALPQVTNALAGSGNAAAADAIVGKDGAGRQVLTAHATIAPLDWAVFVDLPLTEAFAPLYASMQRTAALILLGLLLAVGAGVLLARRMVVPIQALQAGAARIGAGDLDHRIAVKTGDELEALAAQFNSMTAQLEESYAGLERKVQERTDELARSVEELTATSEVLRIIARSPGDLQPVLETLVETAKRVCAADRAMLFRADGAVYRLSASSTGWHSEEFKNHFERNPITPGLGTGVGRTISERRPVQILDVCSDPDYQLIDVAKRENLRTLLGVPLLREGVPIGVITVNRAKVLAFTDREIELLTTFADQAVIAIENTRLLDALQARTDELGRSVEELTATSEILRVIASSPGKLDPVLHAVAENAARLCDADDVAIHRIEGAELQFAAYHGILMQHLVEGQVTLPMKRGSVSGRAVLERRTVHVPDMAAAKHEYPDSPVYDPASFPNGAVGSVLVVPLLREGAAIGSIVLLRREQRSFSAKQIELVESFADQAVIAIENARLLDELQARTAELSRSVDELKALGEVGRAVSSTLDLKTVLETVVARGAMLAEAQACSIYRYRPAHRQFKLWHAAGLDAAFATTLRALDVREDETLMGRAVHLREPVQIADLSEMPNMPLRDASLAAGYHSVLIVPLVRAQRVFGALVLNRRQPGEFSNGTVNLLRTFASQSILAIQNAQLFQEIEDKSRQLEIASQHKSQFLANMSHELRTPLNAILGYTELLLDGLYGKLGERALGVLDRVQTNGKHLLGLINDVLDLAKIEAGQLTLTVSDYAVGAVVQSVVAATESLARSKGLELRAEVAPAMPLGRGDERRLTQVLLNLVGNAIKFTDAGSVTVSAVARDGRFKVAVRDTGPGIAEADQARIFEEFQQVDNSSTRKKGGTGLGLAISKKIVEMHGGTIGVESELGSGATFRLDLPIRLDEAREVA
jgi:signal transduction histidine kinase